MAIEKLKCYKSLGTDKIPPELIMAGGRIIRHDIYKLIISIGNNERSGRSRSLYLSMKDDKIDCPNYMVI